MNYTYLKIFLISFFLLYSLDTFASNKKELEQTVSKIVAFGALHGDIVGATAATTEQWKRFLKFSSLADDAELIAFLDHPSPIIRAYSFQALSRKKHVDIVQLFTNKIIKDNSKFDYVYFCDAGRTTVAEYCYRLLTGHDTDPSSYKLSQHESNLLDIMLLYNPELLPEQQIHLHKRIPPNEIYFDILSELFRKEKKYSAIIPLAKMRKNDVIPLIQQMLKSGSNDEICYGLEAVINFPDTIFFQDLIRLQEDFINENTPLKHVKIRLLYKALAQYKNPETKILFVKTLESENIYVKRNHIPYLWLALYIYKDDYFKDIFAQIKINKWDLHELQFWIENPQKN